MIRITDKSNCTGCTACKNICPKKCIEMIIDNEGFEYPYVDIDSCINCHLCERVCPLINDNKINNDVVKSTSIYAAYSKDDKIRGKSSSGGVFTLLALEAIKNKGRVYGAIFDSEFNVKHSCVKNDYELEIIQGSKYVQSSLGQIFEEIKSYLEKGEIVLFCGTPCQVEGLARYVGSSLRKNLWLVDFTCHGVPSPKVWEKYLNENYIKSDIKSIHFRNKKYGWKSYCLEVKNKNGKVKNTLFTFDKYMQSFLRDVILRPSCYKCHFRNITHRSDITLADYWDINNIKSSFDDKQGVSKVMIHSKTGYNLFNKISIGLEYFYVDTVENKSKTYFIKEPKEREAFFKSIDILSFSVLYNKYVKRSLVFEIKNRLKGYIKILLHYI